MYKFLFLKKTKISIFGGISKFYLWADFGKFYQFRAALGNFGQILLWLIACPKIT
jgi:hypothetical protein